MYTNISCDCVTWRSFLLVAECSQHWSWSLYHVYWHYNPVTEIQIQRPADMKSYGNGVPPQEWVERRVISPWVGHASILSTPWRTGERRLLPGTGLAFLPEATLMFILFILIGPLVFFCIINKQMTICLQHNTLMPYHMMLHVSVCSNHHQALLLKIIKKKKNMDTFEHAVILLVRSHQIWLFVKIVRGYFKKFPHFFVCRVLVSGRLLRVDSIVHHILIVWP